jgi:hypothetical protein
MLCSDDISAVRYLEGLRQEDTDTIDDVMGMIAQCLERRREAEARVRARGSARPEHMVETGAKEQAIPEEDGQSTAREQGCLDIAPWETCAVPKLPLAALANAPRRQRRPRMQSIIDTTLETPRAPMIDMDGASPSVLEAPEAPAAPTGAAQKGKGKDQARPERVPQRPKPACSPASSKPKVDAFDPARLECLKRHEEALRKRQESVELARRQEGVLLTNTGGSWRHTRIH